jgi:hypothetical protein
MTLADIIKNGLNNPECSFFVGSWVGQISIIKVVIVLGVLHLLFKGLDKLAFDPFWTWLKKKIYRKKEQKGKWCKKNG